MKAKRFLTGLLTAAMVLTSLPATAFAEETLLEEAGIEAMAAEETTETGVSMIAELEEDEASAQADDTALAEVGGVGYDTLQDAIDAAKAGKTVELLNDVELSSGLTVAAGQKITLDLAGNTISYESAETTGNAAITNYGELTIEDSGNGGKITYESTAPSAANAYGTNTISNQGGTLTLKDGIIENTTDAGASYAIDNNSTLGETVLKVKGGEIKAVKVAIRQFVNHATATNTVSISDGTITGSRTMWTQLAGSDTSKSPNVDIDITGGTLTAAGESGGYKMAIYSYSYGNSYDGVDINIEGGTFNGDIAVGGGSANGGSGAEKVRISGGSFDSVYSYMDDENADIVISGGTFTEKPADKYLKEGYEAVENADGTFTVMTEAEAGIAAAVASVNGEYHRSLQDAINAAKAGDKVTLLANIDVKEEKNSGYAFLVGPEADITLDLNEYKISGEVSASANYALISVQGKLDIVGEGTIELTNTDNSTSYGFASSVISLNNHDGYTVDTTLTVDDGVTIRHNGGTIMAYGIDMLTYTGCTVNVEDADIESTYRGIRIFANHGNKVLNIKDGSITGTNAALMVQHDGDSDAVLTVSGGELESDGRGIYVYTGASSTGTMDVSITGGKNGAVTPLATKLLDNGSVEKKIEISGGYFAEKPDAAYLAEGLTVVSSNVSGYLYTVGEKPVVGVEDVEVTVETKTEAPVVELGEDIPEHAKTEVEKTAKSVATTGAALTDEAATVATQAAKEAVDELKDKGIIQEDTTEEVTVTVYATTKLVVAPKEYTVNGDVVTLSMDITPVVVLVATTAESESQIQLTGDNKNAVELETREMTITEKEVTISVTLPEVFAHNNEDVFVQHKGTYEYVAEMSGTTATFTSYGFSPFTFSKTSQAVAEVNGTSYMKLQDAMNDASTGDTVTVKKTDTAIVSTTKSVTLKNETGSDITVKINGTTYTVPANSTESFSYTKRSSSGGGGGSSSYAISAGDADNGSVYVKGSASKGSTVTITVTPDEGYELDTLTVTDKNGNEIEVTDNGDGTYSFTMPAGKVEIDAAFREAGGLPANPAEEAGAIVLTVGNVVATVDGETVVNDVAPVIRNERTMLPIRFIAEALGATVTWNDDTDTVTITREGLVIEIVIGQPYALVNGTPVLLDAPAFIENSRTYLPIRFVAENLGATVIWDNDTKQVIIVPGK